MFISPDQIINNLSLKEGDFVADFGCGAGAYIFAASKLVGDKGKVYAIDLHKEILEKINHEADKMNLINIETIIADVEDKVQLNDSSCDVVILSNLLSLVSNIENPIKEAKRVLKPSGIIVIVDWKNGEHNIFQKRHGFVEEEKIVAILAKNDLYVKKHFPAGDYHYAFSAGK